ncbi:hypothetical protein, partial [Klebsiella pneumoniae]|uniref:hypothetical protein n=1 Tax=Klebsiella pneumoniae TaxID=573 RepID=UPI003AF449BF
MSALRATLKAGWFEVEGFDDHADRPTSAGFALDGAEIWWCCCKASRIRFHRADGLPFPVTDYDPCGKR